MLVVDDEDKCACGAYWTGLSLFAACANGHWKTGALAAAVACK